MFPAEPDLELLETDLDGALDAPAAAALAVRLSAEPTLAQLRTALQSQRAQRQDVFRSFEPGDVAVEQFRWRIAGAVAEHRAAEQHHQEQQQTRRRFHPWRLTRWGTAAAACLAFGFLAGRSSHPLTVSGPSPDSTVAMQNTPPSQTITPSQMIAPVSNAVPVANEYGQVVWQPFRSTAEAQDFAQDLNRARLPVQSPLGDNVKLTSDEKF